MREEGKRIPAPLSRRLTGTTPIIQGDNWRASRRYCIFCVIYIVIFGSALAWASALKYQKLQGDLESTRTENKKLSEDKITLTASINSLTQQQRSQAELLDTILVRLGERLQTNSRTSRNGILSYASTVRMRHSG